MYLYHHQRNTHLLLIFATILVFIQNESLAWSTVGKPRIPWLIVGGGIHGVHMAARLLGEDVTHDLVLVDDSEELLYWWKQRTAATGMKYLRSSAGHHLDLAKNSLRRAAAARTTSQSPYLSNDYQRPRLDFFQEHCESIIETYRLEEKHIRGRVVGIQLRLNDDDDDDRPIKVTIAISENTTTLNQTVEVVADHVVLAVGNDEPSIPDWVPPHALKSGMVSHILMIDNSNNQSPSMSGNEEKIAIVGAGLTAAHKALELCKTTTADIHLICRHELREQQFDTHQDWMMDQVAAQRSLAAGGQGLPARQVKFRALSCPQARREVIRKERIPGTITSAVHRGKGGLRQAIRDGAIQWHGNDEVTNLIWSEDEDPKNHPKEHKTCTLHLSSGASICGVHRVLLATGFGTKPPGAALWNDLVENDTDNLRALPTSSFCGYPLVDQYLRWGSKRLFVMGGLAELELGPSARNIAGARMAAERIVQSTRLSNNALGGGA